jgi:CspA family cold shock protein
MRKGKVKFFNNEKGFGFIKDEESGKDVFVHKSNLNGTIWEDDQVSFDIEDTDRGPSAINVKKEN